MENDIKDAKDVLIDFVKNKEVDYWLRMVVSTYINNDGNISEDEKTSLVNSLFDYKKNQNNSISLPQCTVNVNNNQQKIKLKELKHIEGVSALAKNQTIKFSDDMTFIYGLNGSGKSSYYKILYNILNRNHKIIYNNIYEAPENNKKSATLKYAVNNQEKESELADNADNTDFNNVRFFDSEIGTKLLLRKSPDELLLKPFKLNLFSEIISLVDELVEMAKRKIDNEKSVLLQNDVIKLINNYKTILNCECNNELREKIFLVFDENIVELNQKCDNLKSQKNKLEQENIVDSLELLEIKINALVRTKTDIENKRNIFQLYSKIKSDISIIKANIDNKKSQIEIINSIPNSDTDDWKKFVKYGLDNQSKFQDKCPFCHRVYDYKSKEIIKAYIEYLKNDLEIEYSKKTSELNTIKNAVLNTDISKSEGFKYINNSIKQKIIAWEAELNCLIAEEDNRLQEKNIDDVFVEMSRCIDDFRDEKTRLSESKDKKLKAIESLKEKINIFNTKIDILNEKDKICNYYDINDKVSEMEKRVNEISTTKITNLSKKTHNDLLTNTLKNIFQKNLDEILGHSQIQFELKIYSSKGNSQMELFLKDKNIVEILSEGEQKAVSLALFLSEIEVSRNDSPIIFDDPVNSMDNRIADNFANALLRTNNQIVVFSHNLLFFESLQTSSEGHICKTNDTSCNKRENKYGKHKKHIMVYQTEDNGILEKGIIIQYKNDEAKKHIEKVKLYLKDNPFSKKEECSFFIRKAVECIVDEIVFKNLVPTKFSNKNNRLHWDELKNIGAESETIDKLRKIHDRCSGGAMHNGIEQTNNPLTKQEISDMCNELESILGSKTSN